MSELYKKLETCLASVREKTDFKPEVALILGSGLGDYADRSKSKLRLITQILKASRPQQLPDIKADLCLDMWEKFR